MLTQKELKKWLHYDKDTGVFTRITEAGGQTVGAAAGSMKACEHLTISVLGKPYQAHNLAWLYVYGRFPNNILDHIDCAGYHNWISNLRESSKQNNARNIGNFFSNTSGVKGVSWHKRDTVWAASITVDKKLKGLGNFVDFADAVCARLAAEQCLDWPNCDSSSPAFQWVKKHINPRAK